MLLRVELYTFLDYKIYTFGVSDPSGSPFSASNITGLSPVKTEFSLFEHAHVDGAFFDSARASTRSISMTVHFGERAGRVEEFRAQLYRFMSPRDPVTLRFVYSDTDNTKNYEISGYMESFDGEVFTSSPTIQINFLCPDPWFKSVVGYKETLTTGTYPKDRYALGSAEYGFIVEINGRSDAEYYSIWNNIDDPIVWQGTLKSTQKLYVCTIPGIKGVRVINSDGTWKNGLDGLVSGSMTMRVGGYRTFFSVRCQDLNIPLTYQLRTTPRWSGL